MKCFIWKDLVTEKYNTITDDSWTVVVFASDVEQAIRIALEKTPIKNSDTFMRLEEALRKFDPQVFETTDAEFIYTGR